MAWTKKRTYGKFAMKVAASNKKKKGLAATVSALAKIVKQDHKTIAKSLDYADFYYSANNAALPYNQFYGQSILTPQNWTATCRRSNNNLTSPEALLKNMHVSLCCNHGSTLYQVTWYVAVVRAKADWIPSVLFGDYLRALVDYTDMGFGNAPILNFDRFTILKTFSFSSNAIGQGDPTHTHQRRTANIKTNQLLKASPLSTIAAEQNWVTNLDTDFQTSERLYILTFCNTPIGLTWGNGQGPSMYTSVRFTTQQM